ncbi:MAG: nucleotidyl transferase AbiEii/AbiGii toxin family protein [Pseudomonadota bacterium]
MIPRANITEWRNSAPWPLDVQVEQDLVLTRALVEIFRKRVPREELVFRGGTAIHKLFLQPAARYSEDLDLVQVKASPIGAVTDAIREALDSWLGVPKWKAGQGRFTLFYRFETTAQPVQSMRVKIEINTREHFDVFGIEPHNLAVSNPWYSADADVPVYGLDELLGTKLRALYQRKKGRDLFDLYVAGRRKLSTPERVIESFNAYMRHSKTSVSRAEFEANLAGKLKDPLFREDVPPLLAEGTDWDIEEAASFVLKSLISQLPGEPWKGNKPTRRAKVQAK